MWKGWALFSEIMCNHFCSSVIAWSGSMFVYIESTSDVKRKTAFGSGMSFCNLLRSSSEFAFLVFDFMSLRLEHLNSKKLPRVPTGGACWVLWNLPPSM